MDLGVARNQDFDATYADLVRRPGGVRLQNFGSPSY